jgi:Holliday junction resolvase-like predicted endonuclease
LSGGAYRGDVFGPRAGMTSAATGAAAEDVVARALVRRGWTILGRRVRVGRLELDLVAVDPAPPPSLVVVEVRWRGSRAFGLPEETLDGPKLGRLRRAAAQLAATGALPDGSPLPRLPLRLDVVAVEPGPDGRPRARRHAGVGEGLW